MCGITGIFNLNNTQVNKTILQRMTNVLAHRGPDGEGLWVSSEVGLGHRRLKIIDLSDNGRQPMSNEDDSLCLTFNGEIYNYRELKEQLIQYDHIFKSNTDSEVLVHGYEQWGIDCLQKINGMFSFAIYDRRKHQLFFARDRLGIKPFFYYKDENFFLFASEIKSILEHPDIDKGIDFESFNNLISFNYSIAPRTILKNVKQLLPGEYGIVNQYGLNKKRYWDVTFNNNLNISQNECDEKFEELLKSSISKRLVSDVPFGAFLSGGLDSSSIVYYMHEILGKEIKTFSIDFEEDSYSELEDAKSVVNDLGVEHHSFKVKPPDPDFIRKIVWHTEEITADASTIPMFYLSKMTKEHVTMVLSGDGADELLGGYETYWASYFAEYYKNLPEIIRNKLIFPLVKKIPTSFDKVSLDYKLKTFCYGANFPFPESHLSWRRIFNDEQKKLILNEDINCMFKKNQLDFLRTYESHHRRNLFDTMMEVDTKYYLPNDMLIKVDRSSMAHGLEARVPFLDHELVEFLAQVPSNYKLQHFLRGKGPLKRIMKNKLPGEILYKRKKGFNVPINHWFYNSWKDFAYETLSKENLDKTGIFNYTGVRKMLDEHSNKIIDHGYRLYCLVVFMIWYETFITKH